MTVVPYRAATDRVRIGHGRELSAAHAWLPEHVGRTPPNGNRQRDAILCLVVMYLALAPFLTGLSPIFSGLRFALAGAVLLEALRVRPRRPLPTALQLALAVFVGTAIIAAFAGPGPVYGVVRISNLLMFMPLLAWQFTARDRRTVYRAAVAASLILFLGILLQGAGALSGTWGGLIVGGNTAEYNPERASWLTRYTSFLLNPNDLGLALSLVFVMVAWPLPRQPAWVNQVRLLVAALSATGVLLSGSRGAILSLAVIGLPALLWAHRAALPTVVVLVASLSVVSVVAINSGVVTVGATVPVITSVADVLAGEDRSAYERQDRWRIILRSVDSRTGGGFGSTAPVRVRETGDGRAIRASGTVDNSWLKLAVEQGLVGAFTLALALGYAFVRAVVRPSNRLPAVLLAMALLRSLSTDMLDINPWNAWVWLIVACGLPASGSRAPLRRTP